MSEIQTPDVTAGTTEPVPELNYQDYKASRVSVPIPVSVVSAVEPAKPDEPAAETPVEKPVEPAVDATEDETEHEPETLATNRTDNRTPTQKRIDKAVRAQREAERSASTAREEAARLRGRLEVLEASSRTVPAPDGEQAPVSTVAKAAAAMPENAADPKPKFEDFGTYEEGVEATSAWVARQTYRALRQQELDAQQVTTQRHAVDATVEAYNARVVGFKADHPDWDQIVWADLPITRDVMEPYILHSEVGPQIAHYLYNHRDEARAITSLPPPLAFAALGKLEARFETAAATPARTGSSMASAAPSSPAHAVSHAPAPISPVRAAPQAPVLDESEYQTYRRKRMAEIASKAGRR